MRPMTTATTARAAPAPDRRPRTSRRLAARAAPSPPPSPSASRSSSPGSCRARRRSSPPSARSSSTSSRPAPRTSSSPCSGRTTSSPSRSSSSLAALGIGAGLGRPRATLVQPRPRGLRWPSGRSGSWPRSAIRWPTPPWSPPRPRSSVGVGIQTLSWAWLGSPRSDDRGRRRRPPEATDPARRSFLLRTGRPRASRPLVAGIGGRRLLERAASAPVGVGAADPAGRRDGRAPARRRRPRRRSTPGLTPIVMPNDAFYRIDTALLIPSVDIATWTLRIHGLVDREIDPDLGRAPRPADVRAVRDDRLRQQRGRRQPRRQRQVDRRPAARRPRPGRRPGGATQLVGRSVDGWTAGHADGLGHGPGPRADDRREDERRAAAAASTATRPGSSCPACTATCRRRSGSPSWSSRRSRLRRLLGAARLGQGGADPDPVADRHPARPRAGRPGRRSPASPGRRTAASARSRSPSTATGTRPSCRRRSRTRPGSSGSPLGRDARRAHDQVRATDGTRRASRRSIALPAGARRRPRLGHRRASRSR